MFSTPAASKDRLPAVDKSFRIIKQDDKFFTRLLSKETSMANSSSRLLYYGGASGTVPFIWESQPGTPKHTLSQTSMPPLTPPPSYREDSGNKSKSVSNYKRKNSTSMVLMSVSNILPKYFGISTSKKAHRVSQSSMSSESSSLSSWSWSSYSSPSYSAGRLSKSSPTLTLGFCMKDHNENPNNEYRGCCYPIGNMKSAILGALAGQRRLGR